MVVKTKSFRYNPEEHPKIERWIKGLEKAGISFSVAIRRLIEEGEQERNEFQRELEALRRQGEDLRNHPPAVVAVEPDPEQEQEPPAVNTDFIKNRYFK